MSFAKRALRHRENVRIAKRRSNGRTRHKNCLLDFLFPLHHLRDERTFSILRNATWTATRRNWISCNRLLNFPRQNFGKIYHSPYQHLVTLQNCLQPKVSILSTKWFFIRIITNNFLAIESYNCKLLFSLSTNYFWASYEHFPPSKWNRKSFDWSI